jgi:alkane 1-monooxygenase
MNFGALKYFSVFSLPLLAYVSFHHEGWLSFLPVIEAFVLVPILEMFFAPDNSNFSEEEEKRRLESRFYDVIVYLVVPVHFYCLWVFLDTIQDPQVSLFTVAGRVTSMGMLCGVLGINVAHELGHRKKLFERFLAKALLLTSLYMHFYIEHNRGHHKNVSTKEDPSSARFGETLYQFLIRSVVFAYLSAWKLEAARLRKKGLPVLSFNNEMLRFQLIQLAFIAMILLHSGFFVLTCYLIAAILGFLLLETVNYIEHYGLERAKTPKGYERVMPSHSWNSDHQMGRMLLFELSRHSDHHYIASRKYQVLRHMDDSPQMPTGYPGMMLLAIFPPIWFNVMNHRINTNVIKT